MGAVPKVTISDNGRVAPNDLLAEGVVLAAILEEPGVLDEVSDQLRPEHFYAVRNRKVYEAMLAIQGSGDVPTVAAVRDWLYDRNQLQKVGEDYLETELWGNMPAVLEPVREAERIVDKARLRCGLELCREFVARGYTEQGLNSQEFLEELESQVFALTEHKSGKQTLSLKETIKELCQDLKKGVESDPVTTGLEKLDDLTCGLSPGQLWVVAGRPGMGKTSLAMHIAKSVAENWIGSLVFSLEMGREELVQRLCSAHSRIPLGLLKRMKWHGLTDVQMRLFSTSMQFLAELPLSICSSTEVTLQTLRAVTRREVTRFRKGGKRLGVVVVDYLQLVSANAEKGKSREREVAELSRALKLLAREVEVPILLACQLNRMAEGRKDHRPMLSDLRESGAIEQDADVVLLLHREWYYDKTKNPNLCEIDVAKQRNGPTGKVKVKFTAGNNRFEDLIDSEVAI